MKYWMYFSLLLLWGPFVSAQRMAPYQKLRTIPSVRLLNADSSAFELRSRLDKKKPLLIVVFSPECDHCKHETEEMIKNIDKFKDIQIVMTTPLPLAKMKAFADHYKLGNYSNILVGRDYAYVLPTFYGIRNLPFHAFYTKDKKLINGVEGTMKIETILSNFR